MMNVTDHGYWERYKPEKPPAAAPANAMFARRAGDGVDWYDYVNSGENFAPDSVKMTTYDDIVGAAVYDPTMLFPGGATVLEVHDAPTGDPQREFGRKKYVADRKEFREVPPPNYPNPLDDIVRRLKALEDKKG